MLETITFGANFFGFAVALWLGFYLITKTPRNRLTWLTGLMLWSVGGLFLNVLLALSPPPHPATHLEWLDLIFPFWTESAEVSGQNHWLLGWTIGPAIVIWHHVTTLLRGPVNAWRSFRISGGYLVAILAVYLQFTEPWLRTNPGGSPLYLDALTAGDMYPLFGLFILVFTGASLISLFRSAREAETEIVRKQFNALSYATFFASLAGPFSLLGTYWGFPIPIIAVTIPLLIGIILAAHGIARYSALVEGRTLRRGFIHFALGSLVFILFYSLVTAIVAASYGLPAIVYVAALFLAVSSFSLYGVLTKLLDRVVYKRGAQKFRQSLRALNRLAESVEDLDARLAYAVEVLSTRVRASYALLYVFEGKDVALRTNYGWHGRAEHPPYEKLCADDVLHLEPKSMGASFSDAALLLPLYDDDAQIGAILLGQPSNSPHFSPEDVDILLEAGDVMTDAMHRLDMQRSQVEQIKTLALEHERNESVPAFKVTSRMVESALRNITDYAYLGDTPIASLKQVRAVAAKGGEPRITHIDLGKAVYSVLRETVEKLHPDAERPKTPIPREWYSYIVLYDAYFMDVPNREIMANLYISEGTFNRTRRAALKTVARLLQEIERDYP